MHTIMLIILHTSQPISSGLKPNFLTAFLCLIHHITMLLLLSRNSCCFHSVFSVLLAHIKCLRPGQYSHTHPRDRRMLNTLLLWLALTVYPRKAEDRTGSSGPGSAPTLNVGFWFQPNSNTHTPNWWHLRTKLTNQYTQFWCWARTKVHN